VLERLEDRQFLCQLEEVADSLRKRNERALYRLRTMSTLSRVGLGTVSRVVGTQRTMRGRRRE
jgi:hypothetical protein